MKILIWAGCILLYGIVVGVVFAGYRLGVIPTVLLFFGMGCLGRFLCKLWDERDVKERNNYYSDKFWNCRKCGKDNLSQNSRCQHCGAEKITNPAKQISLDWVCQNCGTENSGNYSQCKKCGKFKTS